MGTKAAARNRPYAPAYRLCADENTAARLLAAFGFPATDYEPAEYDEMIEAMITAIVATGTEIG